MQTNQISTAKPHTHEAFGSAKADIPGVYLEKGDGRYRPREAEVEKHWVDTPSTDLEEHKRLPHVPHERPEQRLQWKPARSRGGRGVLGDRENMARKGLGSSGDHPSRTRAHAGVR
jgi:hypothetical protein